MSSFPIPDRFSLLQAAVWLARGRPALPEEIFAAVPQVLRPDELAPEGPLGELVYNLRGGRIAATGGVLCSFSDGDEQPVFQGELFPIEPKQWRFALIDWNRSRLVHDFWATNDELPAAVQQRRRTEIQRISNGKYI